MWKSRWGRDHESRLSGVKVDEDYRRYLLSLREVSHPKVLGFTGADNQGSSVWKSCTKYLKGGRSDPDTLRRERDRTSKCRREAGGTDPGNTLTVSLDVNIQKYAELAAYQVMEERLQKAVHHHRHESSERRDLRDGECAGI